ncbi:MAG: TIGR03757 family integrating conjugative element protein, partial [Nevskiaceae bacterium]
MPVPVFKASPRLPTIRIAPGLWAVLFMFTQTAAADVLVVTDSRHP